MYCIWSVVTTLKYRAREDTYGDEIKDINYYVVDMLFIIT